MARPRKKATPAPKPPAATGTAWDRLSGGAQHGVCLAILLAVAVGFFAPALFSGKSLIGGDTVQWRATAQSMLDYRAAEGEEPLWATNTFAGMPGYLISYERAVPQLDAIPAWLRGFAWPASHFIFLLLGTYLLVVFLTQNQLGAVLAAVAYGLTTYLPVILVAGHNTKFVALCFAPWLVLAFVFALRRPGLLAGLLFAAALAVNLRAGHVQITYYVAFLLGVWWLAEGVGALRRKDAKPFGTATAWLALGAVLGVLMVADPYLVTAEYKNYSIRGAAAGGGEGSLAWDYAMGWSQGWGELVTLLVADAYGGSAAYWGPKPFTGGPHYVGGIVLLLAGLALWRYRRNAVTALGIGTLLMVLFSLGEHLELINRPMFAFFPLFDAFRVPETWLSIVALALAVLAGLGLFYAVRPEAERGAEARKTRAVEIACGVAVGLALLLWVGRGVFFDFEKDGEYEQIVRLVEQQRPDLAPQADAIAAQELDRRAEERADAYAGDALRTLVFLVLAALALVAYRREKIPAWAMQAALVLLVVVDLGGVGRRYFNED
ncbi:MAG: hypothetical protein R3247_15205, partial [Rhodothermales bacterium]|nr:hypothetical protein [Rhodothermales bacterium]